jgi:hypothetical protein
MPSTIQAISTNPASRPRRRSAGRRPSFPRWARKSMHLSCWTEEMYCLQCFLLSGTVTDSSMANTLAFLRPNVHCRPLPGYTSMKASSLDPSAYGALWTSLDTQSIEFKRLQSLSSSMTFRDHRYGSYEIRSIPFYSTLHRPKPLFCMGGYLGRIAVVAKD